MFDTARPRGRQRNPLVMNSRDWRATRREISGDLGRRNSRFRKLSGFGFEAVEMTLRYFGFTSDPFASLAQISGAYGLGQDSSWTPEARIIGVLDHLEVLEDGFEAALRATTYSQALKQAVDRVSVYVSVAPNVLKRVLIRDFRMASLDRLPTGIPLCEVPALAAVCANAQLLRRLRAGENLRTAEDALRHRFGFDQETPAFRSYSAVAAAMDGQLRQVRSDIESELRNIGVHPL